MRSSGYMGHQVTIEHRDIIAYIDKLQQPSWLLDLDEDKCLSTDRPCDGD